MSHGCAPTSRNLGGLDAAVIQGKQSACVLGFLESEGGDMSESSYVLVTPARNEEAFIGKTIESVIRQTVRPRNWIIVDDGSSDGTVAIASSAAAVYPWITVVRRTNRGFRVVGRGSVEAFHCGLSALQTVEYDYIGNLDADIIIGPRYYETILAAFEVDPTLGIAVGSLYETHGGSRKRLSVPTGNGGWGSEVPAPYVF